MVPKTIGIINMPYTTTGTANVDKPPASLGNTIPATVIPTIGF